MKSLASKIENTEFDFNSTVSKSSERWAIGELADEVQVEFSNRITRSLGRTQPVARIIRLNPLLKTSLKHLLEEVLCHELAHIAVYHLPGGSIRPHGPEWQALVRAAGYEPLVRIDVDLGSTPLGQDKCYTHRCPVCHTKRSAKKPMKRWRCSECVANGLSGELEIEGEA